LEHFRRRSLLLQGLREVRSALTQFVEQPRILDGDDCLVGERAHQFDLTLRERLDPLARKANDTNRLALAQQWHPDLGVHTTETGRCRKGVLRIGGNINDVHRSSF
jgi:hypothetical protein